MAMRPVKCEDCREEWPDMYELDWTWQQWQCACCGSWWDLPRDVKTSLEGHAGPTPTQSRPIRWHKLNQVVFWGATHELAEMLKKHPNLMVGTCALS